MQLGFSGRGELLTLHRVEPGGPLTVLKGDWLLSGLYVNELLVRLVQRGEGEQDLFDLYARMMAALTDECPLEPALRRFELALLEACGYGLPLSSTADTGAPVDASARAATDAPSHVAFTMLPGCVVPAKRPSSSTYSLDVPA